MMKFINKSIKYQKGRDWRALGGFSLRIGVFFVILMLSVACEQSSKGTIHEVIEGELLEEVIWQELLGGKSVDNEGNNSDLVIEIVGVGTLSNDERDAGIQQIACYKVYELYLLPSGASAVNVAPLLATYQDERWNVNLEVAISYAPNATVADKLAAYINAQDELSKAWLDYNCNGEPTSASPEILQKMMDMSTYE